MTEALLRLLLILAVTGLVPTRGGSQNRTYRLAFANFGPAATDIYVADGDGNNPRAFLPHDGLDYNVALARR